MGSVSSRGGLIRLGCEFDVIIGSIHSRVNCVQFLMDSIKFHLKIYSNLRNDAASAQGCCARGQPGCGRRRRTIATTLPNRRRHTGKIANSIAQKLKSTSFSLKLTGFAWGAVGRVVGGQRAGAEDRRTFRDGRAPRHHSEQRRVSPNT